MQSNEWKTSSRSGNNGQCVEVKFDGETIQVRDTKNRDGGILRFTPAEWDVFIGGAKDGEFDL